jgi:predicted RNA-binding Zn ribbon-like protein
VTTPKRIGRAAALVLAPRRDFCLDFANTLAWRGSAPSESLHGFPDLLHWCASSGSVLAGAIADSGTNGTKGAHGTNGTWADRHPMEAAAIFRGAIALRETTYRIFQAVASGSAPADGDLSELNRELKETPARDTLQRIGGAFGWRVEGKPLATASALLAPVLWSAGDLLAGPQLERVRECANGKCLWLFLDESKNGSRRWCSMTACGNRAKAHRHYARLKGG